MTYYDPSNIAHLVRRLESAIEELSKECNRLRAELQREEPILDRLERAFEPHPGCQCEICREIRRNPHYGAPVPNCDCDACRRDRAEREFRRRNPGYISPPRT